MATCTPFNGLLFCSPPPLRPPFGMTTCILHALVLLQWVAKFAPSPLRDDVTRPPHTGQASREESLWPAGNEALIKMEMSFFGSIESSLPLLWAPHTHIPDCSHRCGLPLCTHHAIATRIHPMVGCRHTHIHTHTRTRTLSRSRCFHRSTEIHFFSTLLTHVHQVLYLMYDTNKTPILFSDRVV
jgi:hypothetical protein